MRLIRTTTTLPDRVCSSGRESLTASEATVSTITRSACPSSWCTSWRIRWDPSSAAGFGGVEAGAEHHKLPAPRRVDRMLEQDILQLPLAGQHRSETFALLETESGAHLRTAHVGVDQDRPLAGPGRGDRQADGHGRLPRAYLRVTIATLPSGRSTLKYVSAPPSIWNASSLRGSEKWCGSNAPGGIAASSGQPVRLSMSSRRPQPAVGVLRQQHGTDPEQQPDHHSELDRAPGLWRDRRGRRRGRLDDGGAGVARAVQRLQLGDLLADRDASTRDGVRRAAKLLLQRPNLLADDRARLVGLVAGEGGGESVGDGRRLGRIGGASRDRQKAGVGVSARTGLVRERPRRPMEQAGGEVLDRCGGDQPRHRVEIAEITGPRWIPDSRR